MGRYLAAAELLFATIIWGFGFTATLWALESFDAMSVSIMRFVCAFVVGQLLLLLPFWRAEISRKNIRLSALPGIIMGTVIFLQTWGLEYTAITNSGFITTLYVVFVPIFESVFLRRHPRKLHFLWVFLALLGTGLMVNFRGNNLNFGDLLTLFCALLASVHIIMIGQISKKISSPFAFNVYQSLWAAAGALVFWPFYGGLKITVPSLLGAWGIGALAIGSTLIAFGLQVKAQKVLSPSLASLIFLLESPFAVIFAVLLINEKVSLTQSLGGIIIFVSAAGATLTARR